MVIKIQTLCRLELEERLIRINKVLERLSKDIESQGPRKWLYKKAIISHNPGSLKVNVEKNEYDFDNLGEIKEKAADSLIKMLEDGNPSSDNFFYSESQPKWKHLKGILHEANRIIMIDQLELRKNIIEEERSEIVERLGQYEIKKENRKSPLEHLRIKKLVNKYKKNHKGCNNIQAFIAVGIQEGKEPEAVQRNYFYKGKKLQ